MNNVVSIGETMVLFNPMENGPLRYAETFKKQLAGAESNVMIGLAKLGCQVGWISWLGDDELGHFVKNFIRGEGVNTDQVSLVPGEKTGVFFRERRSVGSSNVYYYRDNSAASKLQFSDLNLDYLKKFDYLHLTGITPALSSNCREMTEDLIEFARINKIKLIFDPNYRSKLWSREEAKTFIQSILPEIDILLPGIDEAEILLGPKADPRDYVEKLLELGPEIVALKLGPEGAVVGSQNKIITVPGYKREAVDPVGAGDAFAAGFISALVERQGIVEAARRANACGAFAVSLPGDVEALPDKNNLQDFFKQKSDVNR